MPPPPPSPSQLIHAVIQRADQLYLLSAPDGTLTPAQFAILSAIASLERPNGLDVMRATRIDRSTVSDVLFRLLRRGFITKRRSQKDLRAHVLGITALGNAALAQAEPLIAAAMAELLAPLSRKQRQTLLNNLRAIADAGAIPLR